MIHSLTNNKDKPKKFTNLTDIYYETDTKFVKIRAQTEYSPVPKDITSFSLTDTFDKGGQLGLDAEIIKRIRFTGCFVLGNENEIQPSVKKYIDAINDCRTHDLLEKHFRQMTRLLHCLPDNIKLELIYLDSCNPTAEKFRKIRSRRIDKLCVEIAKLINS